MSEAIPRALRERVAKEARHRCGYCLTDQGVSGAQMHIERIVPRARGGRTLRSNLWLSCGWCNSFKRTRIAAPDPATGVEVVLFNPREQDWSQHFRWVDGGTRIVGLTPTGRATVEALRLKMSRAPSEHSSAAETSIPLPAGERQDRPQAPAWSRPPAATRRLGVDLRAQGPVLHQLGTQPVSGMRRSWETAARARPQAHLPRG